MTAKLGYHISHEQFPPSQLLGLAQQAERAGFDALLSSDHFHPWTPAQGQCGFAWPWLGAALSSTSLPAGFVNAPGQRYHPAIVAQALATLAEMFPGRVWTALGTGQLLNEGITGERWPTKSDRNQRLLECVRVIRSLLAGEPVTHHGLIQVEEARLYTLPQVQPLLFGAAVTEQTAEWVGSWADGLLTLSRPVKDLEKVVRAFQRGGGAEKPMYLKVQLSWAESAEEARNGALDQWGSNIFPNHVLTDLRTPEQLAALAQVVQAEDVEKQVLISTRPSDHVAWLREYLELGFDHLYLHNVNRQQAKFIEVFGRDVLPALR